MYYFKIEGIECSCDTLGELLAACRFGPDVESPKPRANAKANAKATTKATTDKVEAPSETDAIWKLPLIEGGLSWAVVRKVGKKLGRTDYRQLRTDLKKRQRLGQQSR